MQNYDYRFSAPSLLCIVLQTSVPVYVACGACGGVWWGVCLLEDVLLLERLMGDRWCVISLRRSPPWVSTHARTHTYAFHVINRVASGGQTHSILVLPNFNPQNAICYRNGRKTTKINAFIRLASTRCRTLCASQYKRTRYWYFTIEIDCAPFFALPFAQRNCGPFWTDSEQYTAWET